MRLFRTTTSGQCLTPSIAEVLIFILEYLACLAIVPLIPPARDLAQIAVSIRSILSFFSFFFEKVESEMSIYLVGGEGRVREIRGIEEQMGGHWNCRKLGGKQGSVY